MKEKKGARKACKVRRDNLKELSLDRGNAIRNGPHPYCLTRMNTKETMLSGFPLGWTYYVCTERSLGLNHYLHIEAPQWRRCQKKLQTSVTYKWTLELLPKLHLAFCRLYKELKQLGETIMDSRCCLRNTTVNRKTEEGYAWISTCLRSLDACFRAQPQASVSTEDLEWWDFFRGDTRFFAA